MRGSKVQTGLRIPENQYERLKDRADRMGVSINQLVLVLVDIGLNFLDMEQSEQSHSFSHIQKDNS